MTWDLSSNYGFELLRHDIAARVGIERMRELLPPYPADGLTILSGSENLSLARLRPRSLRRPTSTRPT